MERLATFVKESNLIEGVDREPTEQEIQALAKFLKLPRIDVEDLIEFVGQNQPEAVLRDKIYLNVRAGDYYPPQGGIKLVVDLEELLDKVNKKVTSLQLDFLLQIEGFSSQESSLSKKNFIYKTHQEYESLHPFTDCNGRSGRALWLWQIVNYKVFNGELPRLSFLHSYYYQSLDCYPKRTKKYKL